jgi:16S rRNA (cytosine1402-N4)-methyltransferase
VTQDELADVLYELADERASRRIARCIKQALSGDRLNDTLDLRRAVVRAVGPKRFGSIDPATRTFQALRMAVNDEVGSSVPCSASPKRRSGRAAFSPSSAFTRSKIAQ